MVQSNGRRWSVGQLGLLVSLLIVTAACGPTGEVSAPTTAIAARTGTEDVRGSAPGTLVTEAETIGNCLVEDLQIGEAGRDGATGHLITLLGFTNTGDEACQLDEPVSMVASPSGDTIDRGTFFVPVVPYEQPLQPGAQAYVSVDTFRCDVDPGQQVRSVTIEFQTGERISVALELEEACDLQWEGFRSWE